MKEMPSWTLIFSAIALIAAVLGFTGVAGHATNIAWIVFVFFLIMAAAAFVSGRSRALWPRVQEPESKRQRLGSPSTGHVLRDLPPRGEVAL